MLNLLNEYSDIISDFKLIKYKQEKNAIAFVAEVTFKDNSILAIRDYLFSNQERKYSYHWRNSSGNLIIRWDNAPHWKKISTFPHHKHLGEDIAAAKSSREITLKSIMKFIKKRINKP